jgi:hypothetical protein
LPPKLEGELLRAVIGTLNMFPNSNIPTLTPAILFERDSPKLNLKKEQLAFGTIAQFPEPQKRQGKDELKSRLGIALGPSENTPDACRVYFQNGEILDRQRFIRVKADPRDMGFLPQENVVVSSLPLSATSFDDSDLSTKLNRQLADRYGSNAESTRPIAGTRENHDQSEEIKRRKISEQYADGGPLRRSSRIKDRNSWIEKNIPAYLTRNDGINKKDPLIIQADKDEILNMLNYQVGYYVKKNDIPKSQWEHILRTFMLRALKYLPDGQFDKAKSRLVTDGKHQAVHLFNQIRSITVSLTGLFILLNIASLFRCILVSFDVKGAFLHAMLATDDPDIYIRISPDVATLWVALDEEANKYLEPDGSLYLKLAKFIYGLKQAPVKFQLHLTETLLSIGYQQLEVDPCLFVKHTSGHFSIVSTHVDDLLQATTEMSLVEELHMHLISTYITIVMHCPAESYIGMSICRGQDMRDVYLSQYGLTTEIIEKYLDPSTRMSSLPNTQNLFNQEDESAKLSPTDAKEFLSLTMTLMFLARLTRPDILLSTSFAATKSHNPTQNNYGNVQRIVSYLSGTKDYGLHLNCTDLNVHAFADASYASHADGSSHSAYFVTVGMNLSFIMARSIKQRIGSTSSTEAEIIATTECLKDILLVTAVYEELKVKGPVIFVYQDNKSTIGIITGQTSFKNCKAVLARILFSRRTIKQNQFCVKWIPTEHMHGDILSKPVSLQSFIKHLSAIGCGSLPSFVFQIAHPISVS